MKYYHINEAAARTAHNMNSHSDYIEGTQTARYKRYVDNAAEIAEARKKRYPEEAERIDYLLDKYARKLAEWYNKESAVESMCPSVLISGAGNFPVRKKEKQNARRDALMHEREQIDAILSRIESAGSDAIKSGDAQALEKLRLKLERLEDAQTRMKEINAYYRKEKTLDGCPILSPEEVEGIKARMARSMFDNPVPFESYHISNNGAEIRRIKERITQLEKVKAAGTQEHTEEEIGIEGLSVVENTEAMRIQLIFDYKPDEETRTLLKHWGFKWSPSFGAWQRMLNSNGQYAAKMVIQKLKEQEAAE